jgi:hypothetical protein
MNKIYFTKHCDQGLGHRERSQRGAKIMKKPCAAFRNNISPGAPLLKKLIAISLLFILYLL